jgi:hypothetical protein
LQQPEREEIVRGHDRVGSIAREPGQDPFSGRHPVLDRHTGGRDHLEVDGWIGVLRRGAGTGEAVVDLPELKRSTHERDTPTARLDEVLHGHAPSRDAVERDRGELAVGAESVDEHGGDTGTSQATQL